MTAAYRCAVAGLVMVLVALLLSFSTGGASYQRRGVLEVDYGTPTPPAGTQTRSLP